MDLHHPLVQSLALPLLLAFAATGLLRAALGAVEGRRWAAAGTAIALLGAAAAVPGWTSSPGTLTEKLPWIYAIAALLGLLLQGARAGPRVQWFAASLAWVLLVATLGPQTMALKVALALAGMAVILAVLGESVERAHAAAALVVASLGLAAMAMLAGSALLLELGLALAAAVGGCALWLWPVARIAFGASGAIAAVLAWLALAQATAMLTPVRPAALLLLAGAFTSGPILRWARRRRSGSTLAPRRAWADALVVAAIAAAWAAAALALTFWSGHSASTGGADDPYYQPRWE